MPCFHVLFSVRGIICPKYPDLIHLWGAPACSKNQNIPKISSLCRLVVRKSGMYIFDVLRTRSHDIWIPGRSWNAVARLRMGRVGQGSVGNAAMNCDCDHRNTIDRHGFHVFFMSFSVEFAPFGFVLQNFNVGLTAWAAYFPWIMAEVTVPLRTLSVSFPMSKQLPWWSPCKRRPDLGARQTRVTWFAFVWTEHHSWHLRTCRPFLY